MYKAKEVVTRETLNNKLKEKEICDVGKTSLSKILRSLGFKYKRTDNRKVLCELSCVVGKRWKLLRNYIKNMKSENSRQVVFLDETWIFAKGNSDKCSWQDETKNCILNISLNNVKRYIVVHAGNNEGFIPNASLIFSSTKKTDDYHDNMNAEIFEKWFKDQILTNLEEPSLIILDNASYHSRLLVKTPTSNWRKDDIRKWLSEQHINTTDIFLKADLLTKVGKGTEYWKTLCSG